jgi:probable HAF family extracellular repeat protein
MRDLGTLGRASHANAINSRGQVVGYSDTKSGATRAFLWEKGRMRDLGTPGGDSEATAINDRGQVVGTYEAKDGSSRVFLWEKGRMRTLPGTNASAYAITDRGQIVGSVVIDERRETTAPALFGNGRVTRLPMPHGWLAAEAYDVSEHNQIVGAADAYPSTHYYFSGACTWTLRRG